MKPKDPAQPIAGYPGHNKRDDIAIKAMQSILQGEPSIPSETLAERAYKIADAMIDQSNTE